MKIIKILFSPAFMGILFVIFVISMAAATFIENDFGSAASYSIVYNSRWFELILLLLSVNLIGQVIIHKLFRKEKLPIAIFHLSFVLMITGAGITRYFGWEGSIHIREGETSSTCYSDLMSDSEKSGGALGSKITILPFSLRLDAFIMERYPGSNSPSGYKSNVTLIDKAADVEKPFTIFMNNILKYKGYRFYQSSFDKDEKGTILSVNHDLAGMLITYTGYVLLFFFIILSLIIRNSQFRTIKVSAWSSPLRKGVVSVLFFLFISGLSVLNAQKFIPGKESSEEFGKVLVQDQKGRTKPLFTLSNDILRKVSRENKFEGNSPMQVFLGLYFDFDHWKDVPLIRVSNSDLRKVVGIKGNMVSFSNLVDISGKGTYKLSEQVNTAYEKAPARRNKFDKEVMKVDERVNIIYMIYKGDFMKIFPLNNGSHDWGTPDEAIKSARSREDSLYLQKALPLLVETLQTLPGR
jgi:hypothetical protein